MFHDNKRDLELSYGKRMEEIINNKSINPMGFTAKSEIQNA